MHDLPAFSLTIPWFDRVAPILLGGFVVLLIAEQLWALRKPTQSPWSRAWTNGLVAIPNFVVVRLALLPLLVWAAHFSEQRHFGVLHWLVLPGWVAAVLGFLGIDYSLYVWHRLTHRVAFLWRMHMAHHTDRDLSVTTILRFHFGESLCSAAFRAAAVALIGAPEKLVLVYELLFELNVAFHHSNARLPAAWDRALSSVWVTPRMHGIHHSERREETNSNYSSVLNVWDRLHRTLRLDVPQRRVTIGIPGYRDPKDLTWVGVLMTPLRRRKPAWPNAER